MDKIFEYKHLIRDLDCHANMPIIHGHEDKPIYGTGHKLCPRYDGKSESLYDKKSYLSELLPLEEYDLIVVLFSGGKDSTASYFKLLELGVPKSKIELWHHDIDGGHPSRRMDWPVTKAYVKAFAAAEGVKLRVSFRSDGFWGEVYRIGASHPIRYEQTGTLQTCRLSAQQIESDRLRIELADINATEATEQLKALGCRMKFPAKSGNLNIRWCSAYLKITVADALLRNIEDLQDGSKNILLVSGERRGESAGRAKYNEIERHRTNATVRANRLVHQWRNVIDYTERDIWEVLKRHSITPHPCYACGWSRCSCMMCIFSLPSHWAGIKELFPEEYAAIRQDEIRLGFTIDNKKNLDEYVGDAASCVVHGDPQALHQLITGQFFQTDIYQKNWTLPAGAYHGAEGGPC